MEHQEKQAARTHLRAALATIDPSVASDWSEQIAEHLAQWIPPGPAKVGVFAALPGEPDLAALHSLRSDCQFLYPRVVDAELTFHTVEDPATLRTGRFGVREPDPEVHIEVKPSNVTLFLCPGLGFSRQGVRLGRGKGYYDRFLHRVASESPRVGVGYSLQLSDHLPSDSNDVPMTHLADEAGVREVQG